MSHSIFKSALICSLLGSGLLLQGCVDYYSAFQKARKEVKYGLGPTALFPLYELIQPQHYNQNTVLSSSTLSQGLKKQIDFDALAALNQSAQSSWKKLVDCSDGDEEKARQNYFNRTIKCDAAKAALRIFHNQFYQYISTSAFLGSTYAELNDFSLQGAHPLLYQVAAEFVATGIKKLYFDADRVQGMPAILAFNARIAEHSKVLAAFTRLVQQANRSEETRDTITLVNAWMILKASRVECGAGGLWADHTFAFIHTLNTWIRAQGNKLSRADAEAYSYSAYGWINSRDPQVALVFGSQPIVEDTDHYLNHKLVMCGVAPGEYRGLTRSAPEYVWAMTRLWEL
jgi:hypothetical protein